MITFWQKKKKPPQLLKNGYKTTWCFLGAVEFLNCRTNEIFIGEFGEYASQPVYMTTQTQ